MLLLVAGIVAILVLAATVVVAWIANQDRTIQNEEQAKQESIAEVEPKIPDPSQLDESPLENQVDDKNDEQPETVADGKNGPVSRTTRF